MDKRLFVAGTSLTCVLSAIAVPAAAEYELYFGGNLGAAFEDIERLRTDDFGSSTSEQSDTLALLGIHGGANYDAGDFFAGIEADIAFPLDGDIDFGTSCGTGEFCSLDFKAHFRVRAGFDHNAWRFFVAGGFVIAEVDQGNGSNESLDGYTIGAGVEYQPESSPWSARVEVLYDRFDSIFTAGGGFYNTRYNTDMDELIVRGGLTYTFNLNGS